jgi:uncharacterized protein (TIGR03086 family)
MELATLHRRAVEAWQARLEKVAEEYWDRGTPCSEWDVRALVNHVVGEQLWTPPIAEGRTIAEVGDRFDGDVLGADPVATGRLASAEAAAAVDERLPTGAIVHLSFGDVPIEEYVWQLTTDHLVHGWDLAAATDQDRTLDVELVEQVGRWFAERESMYRQGGAIAARGESDGTPQGDLVAAFGRSPSW